MRTAAVGLVYGLATAGLSLALAANAGAPLGKAAAVAAGVGVLAGAFAVAIDRGVR